MSQIKPKINYKAECLKINHRLKCLRNKYYGECHIITGNSRGWTRYSDTFKSPAPAWKDCYEKLLSTEVRSTQADTTSPTH